MHTTKANILKHLLALPVFLVVITLLTITPKNGFSQSASPISHKQVGFGVLVGRISGVTLKVLLPEINGPKSGFISSIDVNLTTDFDEFVLWSAHVLKERPVEGSPLTVFLGPGLTTGLINERPFWGLSETLGVLFHSGPYEVFLQGMPRLYLMPNMNGRFEAATGLRVYF